MHLPLFFGGRPRLRFVGGGASGSTLELEVDESLDSSVAVEIASSSS